MQDAEEAEKTVTTKDASAAQGLSDPEPAPVTAQAEKTPYHENAAPVGKAPVPGSELYHQLDAPGSQRLAGLLWEELQVGLSPFGTDWAVGDQPGARARRSARTGDDYYGVLRQAEHVTAVLTEAAFLTNPAEEALLRTEEFRHAEARAIATAILRYVRTSDPGSGFAPTKEVSTPAGGGGGSSGCVDPPLT